ncbi:hypothetical protein SAMN05445060_1935 [Williamsia sterculiae]|uniref:Uncharacterized protein n=1 Tax=Williamsia sterculiae TaxID=1344003 RepID=A0A1N7FCR2_9NOCA|nr:hypothetical protein SAMN05445060_1935 [Williamsia sterculiae]
MWLVQVMPTLQEMLRLAVRFEYHDVTSATGRCWQSAHFRR